MAETPAMSNSNYSYPSQVDEATKAVASLVKLLYSITDTLSSLRREFKGEALWQDEDGNAYWIQVTKPLFIKIDFENNKPIKKLVKLPSGEDKEVYLPNDEAVEEVLSCLKFVGVNQITALAGIDKDNYLDDLREFECKLAALLALKQKKWGIDKELLPMLQLKIKTLVQDARSLALDGRTLKALQTTVQRVEQMMETTEKKLKLPGAPF